MSHPERPHVLFVSPVAELGGAEQVMLAYARLLPGRGYTTSLALMQPGGLADIARRQGIDVHVFPEQYRFRHAATVLRSIWWLRQVIRGTGANIVHGNHAVHPQVFLARLGTPAREIWHLFDYPYGRDVVDSLGTRLPPAFVLFSTRKVQSGYPQLGHLPHGVVYPCCVDVAALQAEAPDAGVRQRLGLGSEPFFLTIARLQQHKGHRYLIDAAQDVAARYPEARWLVAGQASGAEQERYVDSLRAQVERANLGSRFRFLGFVGDSDLAALRREAVALVHPAISEGYGLVLIEAMAVGTPVIAAAADGPAEIIQDGRTGFLVPVSDAKALAAAMMRIFREPQLCAAVSAAAARDVQSHSIDTMVDETIRIYQKLLSRGT
ncbi:MAG: glycosyltransferase [Gemmatimonadaceae bacterium]